VRARTVVALAASLAAALVAVSAVAQSQGGAYRITREVIAGGGSTADGGAFRLVGTVAQYAAAEQAGGGFRLRGGFHAPTGAPSGRIFADSFEGEQITP
jgi:hypothetical protein